MQITNCIRALIAMQMIVVTAHKRSFVRVIICSTKSWPTKLQPVICTYKCAQSHAFTRNFPNQNSNNIELVIVSFSASNDFNELEQPMQIQWVRNSTFVEFLFYKNIASAYTRDWQNRGDAVATSSFLAFSWDGCSAHKMNLLRKMRLI